MKDLIKQIEKEFDEKLDAFIGEAPETIREYRDDVCFVCGQPFNKSPQLKELKDLIKNFHQETIDLVIKEVIKEIEGMIKFTTYSCNPGELEERGKRKGYNIAIKEIINKLKTSTIRLG